MKRTLAGLATVSVLAIGGIAAAGALGPVANDTTTDADVTDTGAPESAHPHGPRSRMLRGALDAAADAIGISRDDLVAELRDGKPVAEVAEAHDVDADAVIEAIVDATNERVDNWQEERLPELADRFVHREPETDGSGRRHFRNRDQSSVDQSRVSRISRTRSTNVPA